MIVRGTTAPPLAIERLTVRADRLVCDVALAPAAPRRTSPQLVERVCAARPNVPRHACVNDVADTPLPHLLEHLVIDLQTQAAADRDAVFVGTTEWTDERAGRARIEVSFVDDLVALRAFRDAIALLNELIGQYA